MRESVQPSTVYTVRRKNLCLSSKVLHGPERRHGSTRIPGRVFLAWRSSWRMVVYIYYATAAGNSISLHSWAAFVRATGTVRKDRRYGPYKITTTGSLSSSRRGRPPCWASPLAFDLICKDTYRMSLTVSKQAHHPFVHCVTVELASSVYTTVQWWKTKTTYPTFQFNSL